jgi:Uma2 family endonuclease
MVAAMNVAFTRAAEGYPRRAFSVEDIRRMIDAGVIRDDERFELIEGEIVMMAAKSVAHDRVKNALNMAFARAVPDGLFVSIESTLQIAHNILVEPDIAIIARSVYDADARSFARPRAEDILLLVEVAVSSMTYDREIKARLYARHGIREFWVIDANEGVTWIHTGPSGDGWSSVVERGPGDPLTTSALPGLTIRLDGLK